jgi:hypothetical protein
MKEETRFQARAHQAQKRDQGPQSLWRERVPRLIRGSNNASFYGNHAEAATHPEEVQFL